MPLSSSKQIFAPTEAASSTISGNVSFIHCSVLPLFFPALSPEASEKSSQIHAAHSVPVSYGKYLDEEPDDTYIVRTDDLLFVWDNKKDRANIKTWYFLRRGQTTFYDENATVYYDPDHSEEDDRFILLGMSSRLHILPFDLIGIPSLTSKTCRARPEFRTNS